MATSVSEFNKIWTPSYPFGEQLLIRDYISSALEGHQSSVHEVLLSDRDRKVKWIVHYIGAELRNLGSTLPQDKIFGFYSILHGLDIIIPEPDYSKTKREVFETALRAIVQGSKSSEILSFCTRDYDPNGLPSWVPDWSTKVPEGILADMTGFKFFQYNSSGYRATRNSQVVLGQATDFSKLSLPGVIIGKVEFICVSSIIGSPQTHMGQSPIPYYAYAQACRRWCQEVVHRSTDADIIDAAIRTLSFYQQEEADAGTVHPQIRMNCFAKWFDLMLYPNCKLPGLEQAAQTHEVDCPKKKRENLNSGIDPAVETILRAFNNVTANSYERRAARYFFYLANYAFMILDTGHLATGFHVCRQGDVVALISGCNYPVALRPDRNGNFRFVAPLYVDGIMNGEAWLEEESKLAEIVLI
jgi:hypothetical protein